MLTRESIVRVSHEVLSHEVQEEVILLDLRSERYFGIDGVGARIWQLIAAGATVDHVYAILRGEYDVSPERLETELIQFLEEMLNAGLLSIDDANAVA